MCELNFELVHVESELSPTLLTSICFTEKRACSGFPYAGTCGMSSSSSGPYPPLCLLTLVLLSSQHSQLIDHTEIDWVELILGAN